MRLPGWFHHAARLEDSGAKAVWLGKVGHIPHAVLTVEGEIRAANATFRSAAACKRPPVQIELDGEVHACESRTELYRCDANVRADLTAALKVLEKDEGKRSIALGFNKDQPMVVNRIHVTLAQHEHSRVDEIKLRFQGADGNVTSRSVSVLTGHDTEQILEFPDTSVVLILVTLSDASPAVAALFFSFAAQVRPVHIESCVSSPSAPGHTCDKLFDGLHTTWMPTQGEAKPWVTLRFGSFGSELGRAQRRINRINLKFAMPNSGRRLMQMEESSEDAWVEDPAAEAAEEDAAGEVVLRLRYEGGQTEVITIDTIPASSADKGVTVELQGGTGSEVTLTIQKIGTQAVSEVALWYTDHITATQRQAAESNTSTALVQEVEVLHMSDLLQVGYLDKLWDAVKDAAEILAMNICLAGLSIVQGILSLVEAVFNGIASVLIMALEAVIKSMGPHFFKINNLMLGGSFDALKGGEIMMEFEIDMWIFNIHIGPWGFKLVFTLENLINTLFDKAKGYLDNLRL